MNFELGKFYRTRDGRKAQIFMLDNGNGWILGAVLTHDSWISAKWKQDGRLSHNDYSFDIVSEWREPRSVTFNAYVFDHTFTEYAFPFMAFKESALGRTIKARITVEELPE